MKYKDVIATGKHIVGMPFHLAEMNLGWFIYAAPSPATDGRSWELYWVNHEKKLCVEYCICGEVANPDLQEGGW